MGIIIYLINRELVSASTLAQRFNVSVRTIQRDIDSLCLAGIPIVSIQGSAGGYGIMENFKLDRQVMNLDDFFFIFKALKSLSSAYENRKIDQALEKIQAIIPDEKESTISSRSSQLQIDFSVLKEPTYLKNYLPLIEKAIDQQLVLEYEYTNARDQKSFRRVEPLSLTFRWYAWYLFAYSQTKQDYRLFRVSRIRNLQVTAKSFTLEHQDPAQLLEQYTKEDKRNYLNLKLLCQPEIRVSLEDYFPGGRISENEDGTFLLEISLPETEQHWLGRILSYGAKIKVLEPVQLQKIILQKVKELEELYQ